MVVESDSVIYVAVNNAGTGAVTQATMKGYLWGTPANPVGATNISDLVLVSTGNLLVGGAGGAVNYSTNSNASWLAAAVACGAGATYPAASSLAAGSTIYVTSGANTNVYSFAVGAATSTATAIGGFLFGGYSGRGTAVTASAIYALFSDGGNVSLVRALIGGGYTGPLTTAAHALAPINAIAKSMVVYNNVAYFGDAGPAPDRITTLTDTLLLPASNPTLVVPADNNIVQVNTQTGLAYNVLLQVQSATGTTGISIEIAYDALFTQAVIAPIAANPVAGVVSQWVGPAGGGAVLVNFLPGQRYYWRARGTTPYFTGYSAVRSFIIEPVQAPVPDLNSPSNGSSVDTVNPSFSWTPIGGATQYRFQISTNVTFSTILYTVDPAAAGASIPSTIQLNRGSSYYWRVKALAPVEGDWSTVGNFIVAVLPPPTSPPVTVTQTAGPTISLTVTIPAAPPATSVVIPAPTTIVQTTTQITTTQVTEEKVVNPSYIWAIIIIGAVLVIAVIVLIVRTRRTV
jgi:hypothetical protein